MKGVKRSNIFLACLFFIIICLFVFIYFHNNTRYGKGLSASSLLTRKVALLPDEFEGFQQSAITSIQQLLFSNQDSMTKYIQLSTTIQNNDKQQLNNTLNKINEALKLVVSNCNNGNCTNIPRSTIASMQHILFSNTDSLATYIHLSTTIQNDDKQQLNKIIHDVGDALSILLSNCNNDTCN